MARTKRQSQTSFGEIQSDARCNFFGSPQIPGHGIPQLVDLSNANRREVHPKTSPNRLKPEAHLEV